MPDKPKPKANKWIGILMGAVLSAFGLVSYVTYSSGPSPQTTQSQQFAENKGTLGQSQEKKKILEDIAKGRAELVKKAADNIGDLEDALKALDEKRKFAEDMALLQCIEKVIRDALASGLSGKALGIRILAGLKDC